MSATVSVKPSDLVKKSDVGGVVVFDASDRCDLCGAQAYVSTQLVSGVLLWCGHHFKRFEATLMVGVVGLHDERWRLDEVAKLDVSA